MIPLAVVVAVGSLVVLFTDDTEKYEKLVSVGLLVSLIVFAASVVLDLVHGVTRDPALCDALWLGLNRLWE